MARTWKCRKCSKSNPRRNQNCTTRGCAGKRPKPSPPKHKAILDVPYEKWAELYGDDCNICGKKPNPERRHDRDHDHKSGVSRGVLCVTCNRGLPNRITIEWLEAAAEYLRRSDGPERLKSA